MKAQAAVLILTLTFLANSISGIAQAEEKVTAVTVAATQQKKVASLIADLDSDDFGTREEAEKSLKKLGLVAYKPVKKAVAETKSTEVKIRGGRIIQELALAGEENPDELAALARTNALDKKFAVASKFYAKAAKHYKAQASATTNNDKKEALTQKANKALERQKRASGSGRSKGGLGGRHVIQLGGQGGAGGTVRISVSSSVTGGAGAKVTKRVVINGQEVETEESGSSTDDGKGDW